MVKFGKQLLDSSARGSSEIPEDAYMSYKTLKKTIKNAPENFFQELDDEVWKVKDYLLSESEKFHVLASCSAGDRIVLECVLKKAHAITETHIHALEAFISMNREGFRKILKKWDKVHNKTDSVSRMRMINNILVDPVTELDMLIAGATPKTREWSDTKRGRFMAFVSRPLVLTSIVFVTLLVFGLVLAFGVEGSKIANTFFVGVLASFVLALANGANDIANSVGTSVGAGAITLRQAVIFGCFFEFAGALIIGKNVAKSISKGMIEPDEYFETPDIYALAMLSVLIAAAFTTLLATFYGFPISATHSIIGGLISVGMAAKGTGSVGWSNLGMTSIGWVLSPLVGGATSALFYVALEKTVMKKADPIQSAQRMEPVFTAVTLTICLLFMFLKGPNFMQIEHKTGVGYLIATAVALGGGILLASMVQVYYVFKPKQTRFQARSNAALKVSKKTDTELAVIRPEEDVVVTLGGEEEGSDVRDSRAESDDDEMDLEQPEMTEEERAKARILELAEQPFVNLLILSAFTVAFAHGGNDVGNAVGPLCAILSVYNDGKVLETPDIPMWALCLGGAGFCFGIVLLGSNTISTVGTKITKLTPSKSYATQIGAAVAVLLSSAMGLPVSTSHCLVGSVIGIGMVQKCMGAEGSLNFGVLKKIVLGWAVTIPLAMLVSVIIFLPLRPLFE